jgi:integrase
MTQPHTVAENPPSGKEVAKQASRFSAGYWLERIYRPTYTRDGERFEVPQWFARMQHGGRREAVGLGTNNREEGSRKAARFYQTLRSKGWDAALRELDPERSNPRSMTTIGEYLDTVKPLFTGREVTWIGYAYALRKIAMEVSGKGIDGGEKYDPFHKPWQEKANKIKLSSLDPLSIEAWKKNVIKAAGKRRLKQLSARRNVNSFILNARTLFGKKMARRLKDKGLAMPINPFEGVDLEDQGSVKYVSTIKAKDLLHAAKTELEPCHAETYKVILLALGAGLRRGEIDMLCATQLDFEDSLIRVINTDDFESKTDESEDVVYVDASLLAELKKHLASPAGFVINNELAPADNRTPGYYRCAETLKHATKWLVAHGVTSSKPLHALRKEFGSIINAQADIHTASQQLRHSTIKTTAAVYTDKRRRATSAVPIGDMLKTANQ